nr:substrate-binding domain-containing protein [Aeromonas veronii]
MFSNPYQVDLTPALTFVSSPAREIGRQAARRLLTRMQQPELAPNRHIITAHQQTAETGVGLSWLDKPAAAQNVRLLTAPARRD